MVRALALVPAGLEQVPSSLLGTIASLLPVGGRPFRAGLVSAVLVGIASWLAFGLAHRLLTAPRPSRLAAPLALSAALIASLSVSFQGAGRCIGGATLAVVAALGAVTALADERGRRAWVAAGVLVGLTIAEAPATGIVAAAACLAAAVARGRLPSLRHVAEASAAALVVVGLFAGSLAVRAMSDRVGTTLGTDWTFAGVRARWGIEPSTLVAVWTHEVGLVSLVLAGAGAAWGLWLRTTRPLSASLVVFVLADVVALGMQSEGPLGDPRAAARLLSLVALGVFSVLAVRAAARALLTWRVALAEPAAVLLVVFTFTLALSVADRSSSRPLADGRASAAEVWTDEALAELPPEGMVLVRSPAIAWRLWSARVVRGTRPDVVVVPMPWLARGSVARRLLELEPALAGVIREVSINGRPSELSLSTLADARSLYLEIGPDWERRLMDHLRPRPLWLGFAPHALGRSDRRESLTTGRGAFRRVLDRARDERGPDPATLDILGSRATQQAVALAALGDRENLGQVLRDLKAIDPTHAFAAEAERRLELDRRGGLDLTDLLR